MSPEDFSFLGSISINDLDPEDRDCNICLLELEDHEDCKGTAGQLDCGHIFGRECLFTWVEENSSCPMCRAEVNYLWSAIYTWRSHKDCLRSWQEARADLRARLNELKDETVESVVFFRRLGELVLTRIPENGLVQCPTTMSMLIGVLEFPLYDMVFMERDEDEDLESHERRCFLWHLERLDDLLEGSSAGGYYHAGLDPPANDFQVFRIVTSEIGNCLERLRWDLMPDYALDLLFGGDLEG